MDSRTKQSLNIPDREPIPRSVIAEILERLALVEPKAIIFDAVFEGVGPDPTSDQRLADAFAKTPSVIAMSSLVDVDHIDEEGNPVMGRRRVVSLPLFAQSAKMMIPMQVMLTGNVAERITLAIDPTLPLVPLVEPLRLLVDPHTPIPELYDLINYYGPPFTFPTVSMHKLLGENGAKEMEQLRGKIILIGWMDRSINGLDSNRKDSFLTPVAHESMYGVEIQATITANLLERRWLRRLSPEIESILVLAATFLGAMLTTRGAALGKVLLTISYTAVCLISSYLVFSILHYFVPAAAACIIVLPAATLLATFWASKREERQRRELQETIGLPGVQYKNQ
jgi:CHASE2 domain-containing sensor protein